MFAIERSSSTVEGIERKTESYACGRKGHWAHDYECTMSPFSLFPKPQTRTARMTTQLHFSSQQRKVTTCFVLDDCGDDSETFANIVDGKASISMEPKTTGHGRTKMNTNRTGTQDSRMERTVVCCAETFYEIIRNKLCHCSRQRACQQTCVPPGFHKMTPEKPKRPLWVGHDLQPRPQFHEETPGER